MWFEWRESTRESNQVRGASQLLLLDGSYPAGAQELDEPDAGSNKRSFLSVVIPARDEAPSLWQLIDETSSSLRGLCQRGDQSLDGFEMIVVDDGSTDETRSVLNDLIAIYPELRAITLAPGVGQSGRLVAGIEAAVGNWIATLDGDLQNDPADLVRLWNALPGHDVALGWRRTRRDCWSKRHGKSAWRTECGMSC